VNYIYTVIIPSSMSYIHSTLTISGPPGSGTTTIAKLLKGELGLKYVYAGEIFRHKAEEMEMSLVEFGKYVEEHREVDVQLDDVMKGIIQVGNVLVEGRVSGWLAHHYDLKAFTIFLDASETVRAERVANREGKSVQEVIAENRAREASERTRYKETYDFDALDTSFYDLVIDTDDKTPEEIVKIILEAISGGE